MDSTLCFNAYGALCARILTAYYVQGCSQHVSMIRSPLRKGWDLCRFHIVQVQSRDPLRTRTYRLFLMHCAKVEFAIQVCPSFQIHAFRTLARFRV